MKITVAGIGYVGLSIAVLLNEHHDVVAFDIDENKVSKVLDGICPFGDGMIPKFLKRNPLKATTSLDAYKDSDVIVISVPTDYDSEKKHFDTSKVEDAIEKASKINPNALYVIKSTVPIGYTESLRTKTGLKIIFSPEFLRETKALQDNLYPSRIVVGADDSLKEEASKFANLLKEGCKKDDVQIVVCNPSEAESIKLFANTYLALRVSFFNELDTFAKTKGLDTEKIIEGVCLDPRIGDFYNNPSFGYGGYCLPKDTKQLQANYESIPENLISAIVSSNDTRKEFIADAIAEKAKSIKENPTIGIYRMTMKSGSDNIRSSSMLSIYEKLQTKGINVLVYEPCLEENNQYGIKTVKSLEQLISQSDLIAANRVDERILNCGKTVYTSDIFNKD